MRILFITHNASRTGAPTALLGLMETIKAKAPEIDFDLLALNGGPLLGEFKRICRVFECKADNRVVHLLKRVLGIKSSNRFLNFIRNRQYGLVYANTILSLNVASDIKRKYQIPFFLHIHESEYYLHLLCSDQSRIKDCSEIIAVSEKAKSDVVNLFGFDACRIVVQHPISSLVRMADKDTSLIDTSIELRSNPEQFVIGLSGTGDWVKAYDILPFVVKALKVKYPQVDCKFVVIGYVPSDVIYKVQFDLNRIGCEESVVFKGQVESPMDFYFAFDMFLMISREESFSLVLEEAASLRKPIILFRGATGASDWLGEDAALYVPYFDVSAVADAIYALWSDPQMRKKLGDAAYEDIRKLYLTESSMDNIIDKIKRLSEVCLL